MAESTPGITLRRGEAVVSLITDDAYFAGGGTVVGGEPVATGVVPLADAWSCTNPSLGRGVSLGVVHGGTVRHAPPVRPGAGAAIRAGLPRSHHDERGTVIPGDGPPRPAPPGGDRCPHPRPNLRPGRHRVGRRPPHPARRRPRPRLPARQPCHDQRDPHTRRGADPAGDSSQGGRRRIWLAGPATARSDAIRSRRDGGCMTWPAARLRGELLLGR
jgi:hypothetical protein